MLFYGPDNQLLRRTIPLSADGIRALVDGDYFLVSGIGVLSALQLEPYCRVCAGHGHAGTVVLSQHEPNQIQFRCAHTCGHVLTNRRTEVEALLDALQWGIRCSACHEEARGDNARTAATFTVTCGCTTRELANPVPPVVH